MEQESSFTERGTFTVADKLFIQHTLCDLYASCQKVEQDLGVDKKRYRILAHPKLFRAACELGREGCLTAYAYYAIQVYQAFQKAGIRDVNMCESIALSVSRVAQQLHDKADWHVAGHIPLLMIIGIKPGSKPGTQSFQVVGSLQKACVIVEGFLLDSQESKAADCDKPAESLTHPPF
jgi:hypothetical protein